METQRETWQFYHIGFIILPVNQLVSCGSRCLSFRGLDRYPGFPFTGTLPDDPEPLQDLVRQKGKALIDPDDFFQEEGKAVAICVELNAILRSLCAKGESIGSFDPEYEVVGCNIEGAGLEIAERISRRLLPPAPAPSPERLLGYDVAMADGDFSAIQHGLFGLTRWLDEFCANVNEYGLFPTPALANRFRQAYCMSPSQEKGELCIHELFLPETAQSEAAVQS